MSITTKQKNANALLDVVKRIKSVNGKVLAIGIPTGSKGASAAYPDGTSLLMVAAANNFGANIDHPGGTGYVVSGGKARFVSKDFMGPISGITKPHKIIIPARPFMSLAQEPMIEATAGIAETLIPALNAGKITPHQLLKEMGPPAVGAMKNTIVELDSPPNAASTIRKKKSDNPLEDSGRLDQSITYAVRAAG